MRYKLVYLCSPRPFAVPPRLLVHGEKFGLLNISESRTHSQDNPYGLRMEAEVSTSEEAEACHREGLDLANDLNTVWAYVAGMPLFPTRLVLATRESPTGWNTNYSKLQTSLPTSQPFRTRLPMMPGNSAITLRFMPLKPALAAVRSYRAADEDSTVLIGLHVAALQQHGSEPGLVLLAKALALARLMLPGKTDKTRQEALPVDVLAELRCDLSWLCMIAKSGQEFRRVEGKETLVAKFDQADIKNFLHDADLVVRGVVERGLGIKATVIRDRYVRTRRRSHLNAAGRLETALGRSGIVRSDTVERAL